MQAAKQEPKRPRPPSKVEREMAVALAALLDGPSVQSIGFHLGHVHVEPTRFRHVAAALRRGDVTVALSPANLPGAVAAYSNGLNLFFFKSDNVLRTVTGRSAAVHEAVHAGIDWAGQRTALLHEEGAGLVAEAWYLINIGMEGMGFSAGVPSAAFEIAYAMRRRAKPGGPPVPATNKEIQAARRAAQRSGYAVVLNEYPDGF